MAKLHMSCLASAQQMCGLAQQRVQMRPKPKGRTAIVHQAAQGASGCRQLPKIRSPSPESDNGEGHLVF